MSNEMLQLTEMLENHRLEVEFLKNKIDDLQAYKDLSIYLANSADIEKEVLRNLLSARWSIRDRPMDMVISDLIDMKIKDL